MVPTSLSTKSPSQRLFILVQLYTVDGPLRSRQTSEKRRLPFPTKQSSVRPPPAPGIRRLFVYDASIPRGSSSSVSLLTMVSSDVDEKHRVCWSTEEDQAIVAARLSFGTDWERVAEVLPGRTADSVRNRWRRLAPLIKIDNRSVAPPSNRDARTPHAPGWVGFTPDEDRILMESIASFGCKWRKIAALLPGRTESSVRNRYVRLNETPAATSRKASPSAGSSSNSSPLQQGNPGLAVVAAQTLQVQVPIQPPPTVLSLASLSTGALVPTRLPEAATASPASATHAGLTEGTTTVTAVTGDPSASTSPQSPESVPLHAAAAQVLASFVPGAFLSSAFGDAAQASAAQASAAAASAAPASAAPASAAPASAAPASAAAAFAAAAFAAGFTATATAATAAAAAATVTIPPATVSASASAASAAALAALASAADARAHAQDHATVAHLTSPHSASMLRAAASQANVVELAALQHLAAAFPAAPPYLAAAQIEQSSTAAATAAAAAASSASHPSRKVSLSSEATVEAAAARKKARLDEVEAVAAMAETEDAAGTAFVESLFAQEVDELPSSVTGTDVDGPHSSPPSSCPPSSPPFSPPEPLAKPPLAAQKARHASGALPRLRGAKLVRTLCAVVAFGLVAVLVLDSVATRADQDDARARRPPGWLQAPAPPAAGMSHQAAHHNAILEAIAAAVTLRDVSELGQALVFVAIPLVGFVMTAGVWPDGMPDTGSSIYVANSIGAAMAAGRVHTLISRWDTIGAEGDTEAGVLIKRGALVATSLSAVIRAVAASHAACRHFHLCNRALATINALIILVSSALLYHLEATTAYLPTNGSFGCSTLVALGLLLQAAAFHRPNRRRIAAMLNSLQGVAATVAVAAH